MGGVADSHHLVFRGVFVLDLHTSVSILDMWNGVGMLPMCDTDHFPHTVRDKEMLAPKVLPGCFSQPSRKHTTWLRPTEYIWKEISKMRLVGMR